MGSTSIVINNFNRLSTTKRLVDDLMKLGYSNIHILDNNSTYDPLIDWYQELLVGGVVKVVQFETNFGQLALWNSGYMNQFKSYEHIVYTDSDIQLNENTKHGFIEEMANWIRMYSIGYSKIGLALQINDLPDSELGNRIRKHEAQFWTKKRGVTDTYDADVDTTFAVIDPNEPFTYKAIRVAGDFTAKHIPWYVDWSNITEEEKYVLDHLDSKYSTYKGYYLEWLKSQ